MRSRAKPKDPIGRFAAALAVSAAVWLSAATARAQVTLDLAPSASLGITDNARLTPVAESDEYSVLAGGARVRWVGARFDHSFGYRLSWTHYFEGHGIDNLSNEAALGANFNVTPTLDLHLLGSAMLSRISYIPLTAPGATLPPQGVASGTSLYLSVGGSEEMVYRPSARWQYLESLGVSHVTFLESPAPPDSLLLTLHLRADLISGIDSYSLDAMSSATFSAADSQIANLLAGWRREYSATWSTEAQAGVMGLFRENASPTIGPAGSIAVNYRQITWFANMTISRIPTANLFLGQSTVNNQAVLRLTLPLTRDEMVVVSGAAGYVYANPANDQFTRAFDQRTASVLLGTRLGRLPLHASLEYSVLSQHGNPDVPMPPPDLFRQILMLTLTGTFTFGPGTPPILGAPM